jgi:hypothetical protein
VLTLGDNRKVDFSRSIIFMTTNLGAAEMSALLSPKFGFRPVGAESPARRDENEGLSGRIERTALLAVRRKFSPEFINRLDKIIVFQPLGVEELRKILDIELDMVQQRIFVASRGAPFVFQTTEAAKSHLLQQGVDFKIRRQAFESEPLKGYSFNRCRTSLPRHRLPSGTAYRLTSIGGTHSLKFLKEQDTFPSPHLPEMMRRHTVSSSNTPAKGASGNRAVRAMPMPLRHDLKLRKRPFTDGNATENQCLL